MSSKLTKESAAKASYSDDNNWEDYDSGDTNEETHQIQTQ
jgi:hypothetical protein